MVRLNEIIQYLTEQFPELTFSNPSDDRLIYHAEIPSACTVFDENTLYIASEDFWDSLENDSISVPAHPENYLLLTCLQGTVPFHVILLEKTVSSSRLCVAVNSFLKSESIIEQHTNQLYHALYHSHGLKDLANTAEAFLKHPISICDTSYNIIEASTRIQNIPYGLEHNQSRTFLNAEEIESLKRLQIEDRIYENSRAFFSRTADHPDTNWIFCAIRIQNVMAGYVAVCLEADIEATEYDLRITTALADACAIEMQKHDFFVTRSGMKYENFLIDLLEGRFNDVNLISSRLELLDRKFCKFFCLVVLSCNEPHDNSIFNKRQMSILRQVYPNSMSVVYHDAIVLFLNQEKPILMKEDFLRPLEEFARRNHMKAGISQPFGDILRINSYYHQALNTLNLGEAHDPESVLYFGSDLLPQYLFSNSDYTGLSVGIHHHLHHLADYDRENHTEFIPTLRAYLQNDRNATRTAEALHIHRSTFFYRIKKIEELLDISITDSKLLFLYELSFLIWDYLSTC